MGEHVLARIEPLARQQRLGEAARALQVQAAVGAGTVGETMLITVVRGDARLVLSVVPAAAAA